MYGHILLILILITAAGCAANREYNPVAAATEQTFLLNESALAQVKTGMTQARVHEIMGDALVIGYSYEKALTNEADASKSVEGDYKPLTIANPYKTENITTAKDSYVVEYYVNSVKHSDGVVSDEEMVPLIFQGGILKERGWERVHALRAQKPS